MSTPQGYKFWRFDDMDTWEQADEPSERNERLRELVDGLDGDERHMIERVMFGQATKNEAGSEIGLTTSEAVRTFKRALEVLRELVQEEDGLGPLRSTSE